MSLLDVLKFEVEKIVERVCEMTGSEVKIPDYDVTGMADKLDDALCDHLHSRDSEWVEKDAAESNVEEVKDELGAQIEQLQGVLDQLGLDEHVCDGASSHSPVDQIRVMLRSSKTARDRICELALWILETEEQERINNKEKR